MRSTPSVPSRWKSRRTPRPRSRMLSAEPYDLVAVDPAISSGGFALLKHIKDNYRWTATLVATHNQDPQFLRQAVKCRIDGLLFRPATSDRIRRAGPAAGRGRERAAADRQQKRVLAIGAHPDDVEIGCGGALAKHHCRRRRAAYPDAVARRGRRRCEHPRGRGAAVPPSCSARSLEIGEPAATPTSPKVRRRSRSSRRRSASCGRRTSTRIRSRTRTRTIARFTPRAWWRRAACPTSIATRRRPRPWSSSPNRFVDITHFIKAEDRRLIGAYKSQVDAHGAAPARRHRWRRRATGAAYAGLCAGRAAADRPPARQRDQRPDMPPSSRSTSNAWSPAAWNLR